MLCQMFADDAAQVVPGGDRFRQRYYDWRKFGMNVRKSKMIKCARETMDERMVKCLNK